MGIVIWCFALIFAPRGLALFTLSAIGKDYAPMVKSPAGL
jgi:hypothetical protein